MKRIILVIVLLWLPSVMFSWNEQSDFFYWRHQLIMLSGILGLSCMTGAMVLSTRWQWVEDLVNGLDKGYALHKRMGIGALVFLLIHWLLVQIPKWLGSFGLITRPVRIHRMAEAGSGIRWEALAREIGEYTFYVFLIFAAISLIQLFTYRQFKWIHKIGGALFIAATFHSLILMKNSWSSAPANIMIVLMGAIGVLCAMISLSGNIGRLQKVPAYITAIQKIDYDDIPASLLHFSAKLEGKISYIAGQFAYIDFLDGEPPHPFTILNYDESNNTVEFAIKDLGDYTHRLMYALKTNQNILIEGGYGRFHIPEQAEQAWIGAGVGIVPFVSWLYRLTRHPNRPAQRIHLFYCRRSESETFFEKIIRSLILRTNNVELHIVTSKTQGRLSIDTIKKAIHLSTGSVCFCGPDSFGNHLQKSLVASGLPPENFHREYFKVR